jgi:hypothetical protein
LGDFSNTSKPIDFSAELLRKVYAGSILNNASQDHRILSIKVVYLSNFKKTVSIDEVEREAIFEHFLLFCVDSRGWFTVVDVNYSFTLQYLYQLNPISQVNQCAVTVLHQAEVSVCPLLCCDVMEVPCSANTPELGMRSIICSMGDTKGDLYHLLVPVVLPEDGTVQ